MEQKFYIKASIDAKLTLASLCLGSFFLAKSRESYTMAKPVVLPPPNCVLKPNTNTTSGVVLYILASFSLISVLGTVALPGCRTSTTYKKKTDCMKEILVWMASTQRVLQRSSSSYHLLPLKQPVRHELAGPDCHCVILKRDGRCCRLLNNISKSTHFHISLTLCKGLKQKREALEFCCTLTLLHQVPHPLLSFTVLA